MSFKVFFFFFFFFFFSIISVGGHFVQRSGTILAILTEGYSRNISMKLLENQAFGLGDVVKMFFFLFYSGVHLFGAEPFL